MLSPCWSSIAIASTSPLDTAKEEAEEEGDEVEDAPGPGVDER